MSSNVVGISSDRESRSVRVDADETLLIHYDIEVDRGELSIYVRPGGMRSFGSSIFWMETYESSSEGTAEVPIEESGTYDIIASMNRFGGSYDITWEVE